MKTFFLEYIWLDGNKPQQIRSKTKIVQAKNEEKIKLSEWGFDGSSTNQALTSKSEMVLKPVNKFKDPFRDNGFLVICEVYNTDGTPHETNKRSSLFKTVDSYDQKTMYGFEQEYIIYDRKTNKPLGWPVDGYPKPQGDYYCGVGGSSVSGRKFVERHAELCQSQSWQTELWHQWSWHRPIYFGLAHQRHGQRRCSIGPLQRSTAGLYGLARRTR